MLLCCLTLAALASGPSASSPSGVGSGEGAHDVLELSPGPSPGGEAVVGGRQVRDGRWDDAVGIESYGAYIGCTGTLIGPKVVLTAGHCVLGGSITRVLFESKDWRTDRGTYVGVDEVIEYPGSQQSFDVAVLLLEERAPVEPRELAVECILREYLEDGAPAQIVGYGATTERGTDVNSKLNEARTTILDKNCDESFLNGVATGCKNAAQPRGELAAGGNGTDACFGDSGGPLYLKTDAGDYLVGVTSRAFLGVDPNVPCRDGGIWVRPDAVLDWIEEVSGARKLALPSCNEAPEIVVPELIAAEGGPAVAVAVAVDPDGDPAQITWSVVEEPEHGSLQLGDQGQLTYEPDAGYVGEDRFVIAATDGGNEDWARTGGPVTSELEVPVQIVASGGGLSCRHAGGVLGWLPLLPLLLGLRRR